MDSPSASRAIGDRAALRFVAAVALLGILNAAVLWWIYRQVRPREAPLMVEGFWPQGEASPQEEITIRFNRDVLPPGAEVLPATSDLVRLVPAVPGRWRWRGSRILVFEAAYGLPPATPLRAVVSERLGGLAGLEFQGEREFAFWTEPLKLVRSRQVGFTRGLMATVRLEFNDRVSPADLRSHLQLLDRREATVPFEILTPRPSEDIDVRTLAGVDQLTIRLEAGLRGAGGPLGLESEVRVPLPLTYRLRLTSASSESVFRGWPRVLVRFNNPVDADRSAGDLPLSEYFRVEPAVEFEARPEPRSSAVALAGNFKPGATYRVTVLKGLRGHGETFLVEDSIRDVLIPDRARGIAFQRKAGYLSPKGNGRLWIESSNVSSALLQADRVPRNNLVHFLSFGGRRYEDHFLSRGDRRQIRIEGAANEVVESAIDLREVTGEPLRGVWRLALSDADDRRVRDELLVAATDLGLTAKVWRNGLLVWVTSLASGQPVRGAQVHLLAYNNQELEAGVTDRDGVVSFEGPLYRRGGEPARDGDVYLVACEKDGDLSYLEIAKRELSFAGFDIRGRPYLNGGYEAYLFTDRGVYRPGETVRVRAIVRDRDFDPPGEFPAELEVLRPDRRRFRLLKAGISAEGSAGWDVAVPETARTGRYWARLRLPGDETRALGSTSFLVEDFLPARARATLSVLEDEGRPGGGNDRDRRFESGEKIALELCGELLAGLPAAGSRGDIAWTLRRREFRHPHWQGYRFGNPFERALDLKGSLGSRTLGPLGKATFEFDIPEAESSSPLALRLAAEVKDFSGRATRADVSVAVDPRPFYLGIRPAFDGAPEAGEPAVFEFAAVQPDGAAGAIERLDLDVVRREWSTVLRRGPSGRYRYESEHTETEVSRRRVPIEGGRGEAEFTFETYGDYLLRASSPVDGATASMEFWVSGSGWASPPNLEKPEELEISVEPVHRRPGGKARVAVRAPFAGGMLLTLETDRVLSWRAVAMDAKNEVVDIELPSSVQGNLYVGATVVRGSLPAGSGERPSDRPEDWAPRRAYGVQPVCLDFSPEQLVLAIDGPDLMEPRSRGLLYVRSRSADGEPRDAEVSLAIVDEGILARSAFETPDPWSFFYARRALGVSQMDIYGSLLPEVPLESRKVLPGGGVGESTRDDDPLERQASRLLPPVRGRRVKPIAIWLGTFRTGADGELLREFELPPFSGRLRAMAVAHDGKCFGSAAKPIAVRGPLHLEVGLPRFLAPGDRFLSRAALFNASALSGTAVIDWTLDGPVRPAGVAPSASGSSRRVELARGGSARLEMPFQAEERAGVARIALSARLGGTQSAERIELPVRPAAASVRRTLSGHIRAGEPLDLHFRDGYLGGTAHRRLVFAPFPELQLFGSLSYLVRYPHGCLEQTTSRVFPLLYLKDLAKLLRSGYVGAEAGQLGDSEAWVGRFVDAGIERILGFQKRGGWLAMWPGGGTVWFWGTCYAAHFLVEARKAGYAVPERELEEILAYLEERLRDGKTPILHRAYAALVLALARRQGARAAVEGLISSPAAGGNAVRGQQPHRSDLEGGEASSEARFLLAAACVALGDAERARACLGDQLPAPGSRREIGGALRSPARHAALLLSIALDIDAASPWIPALAQRLESYRVDGRWGNTQENAFAAMALGKHARRRNAGGSDYTARIRLSRGGEDRTVEMGPIETRVLDGDFSGARLTASLEGEGGLFWFLDETGVPAEGGADEVDSGVKVRRRYLDALGADLAGRALVRGQVIQVEIRIEAGRSLENLVVTDLLPAGLEVENPRLDGYRDLSRGGSMALSPDHVDIRDDRVLLYLSLPRSGAGICRYAARAVTAGDFALPAASVESLYDPGVYSRHGAGRLRIEAAPSGAGDRSGDDGSRLLEAAPVGVSAGR